MLLSRAHRLQREAEKATRKGRLREALARHREAAAVLEAILRDVVADKARESLRLQAQFHHNEQR